MKEIHWMPIDWKTLEEKWQKAWTEAKIFEAEPDPRRKKFFATFPFPYMSGPLHVGHAYTMGRVDTYARFMRMKGLNVLFPFAWHWTGETVAGASERIKIGDEKFIAALRDIDGVPEEELKKFVDPVYMARYYTDINRVTVKRYGVSVDWRREFNTTSHNKAFSRFVEWQYWKLKELNYVKKGTHPVIWCPHCESPTGDADRLEGENVSVEEYSLVKFKFLEGDIILPAATFRPETIFGATNLWINPEGDYVKTFVNDEVWIVSKACAEKLKEQLRTMKFIRNLKGRELIGRSCVEPVGHRNIPILPGWFVETQVATGVVYSVPAHAPFDWIALRDIQNKPELLREFRIGEELVKAITPISIIKVEGFGDFPAVEIVDQMKIKDQFDPKTDEATKIIYKKEFHTGVLKENCAQYSGLKVSDVKKTLVSDLKKAGTADSMFDIPSSIVCRCTTPCFVKVLRDQWFLNYSNEEWKAKTRELLANASVYPAEARNWFEAVIEWLRDWACVRRTGLGTPLPWSPDWIVETLSDSTIYPAFYTINKHIKLLNIDSNHLTEELFDYLFLGKGDAEAVAEKCNLDETLIKAMRDEFLYWYPVDLRNSAKDLVPNHLSFFLFHHAAIFPKEHWPRTVSVNGFMRVEGEPMHKSKGNFIPLNKAVDQYGSDPTRCTVLLAAEEMDDPDWRSDNVRDITVKLDALLNFADQILNLRPKNLKKESIDRWLLSVLQNRVRKVTDNTEILKTRTALEIALFEIWNDFRWYYRRTNNPDPETLREALDTWIKLLAPFVPHLAEEIWHRTGNTGFIAYAPWPTFKRSQIDVNAEEAEDLVKRTLADTQNVVRATKMTPTKIYYYVSSGMKWNIYLAVLQAVKAGCKDFGEMIKVVLKDDPSLKTVRTLPDTVRSIFKEATQMPGEELERRIEAGPIDEGRVLKSSIDFFSKELGVEVLVYNQDDLSKCDPKNRAKSATPYRPAIYIE
jgi:leucyl-tRNA synthetase